MVDGTGVKNENESNKKKKDQQLFLLIDVIVGDIKIKQQAQILKLYVLQTTTCEQLFLRDIWIETANEIL